jgi:diphthamide biosynthesis protein 3
MGDVPYEEVRLADMAWSEELQAYTYECPCGDVFQITGDELAAGEDIAHCPSCSLVVRVLCDADAFAAEWEARHSKPPDAPPPEAAPQPVPVA